MHTENAVVMGASRESIFALAAEVEAWPEMLAHYRWVRLLRRDGNRKLVEMAASRDGIPLLWWAEQELFPAEGRITYHHVRGVTTGMWVEWTLTPHAAGTAVRIVHDLVLPWPLIGRLVADRLIGPLFVENIAGKTLASLRVIAEARAPVERVTRDH